MPLKPGQNKDLQIRINKVKGLEKLEDKVNVLIQALGKLAIGNNIKSLKKDFSELANKVQAEITATNKEIMAIKSSSKSNPALTNLVKNIEKECSQVVSVYRKAGMVLFRGSRDMPVAFVGRSWTKRKPRNSLHKIQEIYDDILKKKGFKALRSNSIFTTADKHQTEEYGTAYIIFPKNGFSFHWNQFWKDLTLDRPDEFFDIGYLENIMNEVGEWMYDKTGKEFYLGHPYEVVNDLESLIKKIKATKWPGSAKLTPDTFINYDFINKEIGPTDKNFLAGLKSGNEVMISGEYYAVELESEVGDYVLNALKIESADLDFYDDDF